MSDTEDKIFDLLDQWALLHKQGKDVVVEELCRDCPELVEELKRRIGGLKSTDWLDKPIDEGNDKPLSECNPASFGLPDHLGRYRLDALVGEGGFGQVWRGYDEELHRSVAIKIPRPDRVSSPERIEAFMQEARRVAQLKHPGIVPIYDVGRDSDICFIVSDLIEGENLAERIERQRPAVDQSTRLAANVADILHHAHQQGFVHRDIKPANILLDEHDRAFLTDFGIAVDLRDENINSTSVGTLAYMAPEQLAGETLDHRSDIYSLGVVLYELLTGQHPHEAPTPGKLREGITSMPPRPLREFVSTIPPELERICLKCLEKDPQQRYTDALQLRDELLECLDSRRSHLRQWGIAIFVVVLCVAGGIVWWTRRPAPATPETGPAKVGNETHEWEAEKQPPAKSGGVGGSAEYKVVPITKAQVEKATIELSLGKACLANGENEKGIEHFTEVLKIYPTHADALHRRGACYFNLRQFDKALADLTRANDYTRDNTLKAEILKNLSYSQLKLGKFDEGIATMLKALRLAPEAKKSEYSQAVAIAYGSRAANHDQHKRHAEAIADLDEAIKHAPKFAVSYDKRGSVYFNMREHRKALEDFNKAIELDGTNAEYFLHRGHAHRALGEEEKGRADYEKANQLRQ